MEEHKFLKFLDKFKGIYIKFGIDYEKMRLILNVKLTLDSRRTATIMKNSTKEGKREGRNSFIHSLFIYAVIGIFIGVITLCSFNKMYSFSITFGIFMFLILTVFISDFSNVLLDIRDKNILGTKGIDNKTINAAKLTHICYYIVLTSLSLSWLSIIGMFRFSVLTGIVFIIELIVTDVLMVVITGLIYLLIIRFFDGEKVKDIINCVQIVLTIVLTVGYQFLGRMFDVYNLQIIYKSKIWNLFIPPMWFAAPLYAINGGKIDGIIISLIILAVAMPIIAINLYIKNTSKFEDSLSKLSISSAREKEKYKGLFYKIGRLVCRNSEEKAVYDLSTSVMKREREFKLMAYPNLGFIIIFPLLFVFIFSKDIYGVINNISLATALNIYWFVIMIPSILMTLQYSNNYKAAWIYEVAFISDKANIYKGAYKALLFNLLLPIYVLESIIFIVIFGIKVVPILIIAFTFLLIFIIIDHSIVRMRLPFTVRAGVLDKERNLISMMLGMVIIACAVAINYFLLSSIYALMVYEIILGIIAFIMWKNLKTKIKD